MLIVEARSLRKLSVLIVELVSLKKVSVLTVELESLDALPIELAVVNDFLLFASFKISALES